MQLSTVPVDAKPRSFAALQVCVAAFCLALHDAVARHLVDFMPVVLLIWARYFVHVVGLSAYGLTRQGRSVFHCQKPLLHLVRAVCLVMVGVCFILGLQRIPLAEATALLFLSPIFVLLISRFLLAERVRTAQWLAVLAGLIGVLLIVRPGGQLFVPAALLPCGAAVFVATYQITTRAASRYDSSLTAVLWLGICGLILSSVVLPFFWVTPNLDQALYLLLLGIAGTAAHWLLTSAFASESPAALAPFSYTQIVSAGLLGFLIYGVVPDAAALAGVAMIVGGGLMVVLSKGRCEMKGQ